MILTRIRKGLPTHSGVNCEAVLKNLLGGSKGDVTELFKLCSYSNLPRGGFLKAPNPKPQGLLKSNILLLHHLEQTLFQYAQLTNFVNFAFQHHFTSLYITLPLIYYLEIASNEWSTANKSDELLWSLSLCWSLFFFFMRFYSDSLPRNHLMNHLCSFENICSQGCETSRETCFSLRCRLCKSWKWFSFSWENTTQPATPPLSCLYVQPLQLCIHSFIHPFIHSFIHLLLFQSEFHMKQLQDISLPTLLKYDMIYHFA